MRELYPRRAGPSHQFSGPGLRIAASQFSVAAVAAEFVAARRGGPRAGAGVGSWHARRGLSRAAIIVSVMLVACHPRGAPPRRLRRTGARGAPAANRRAVTRRSPTPLGVVARGTGTTTRAAASTGVAAAGRDLRGLAARARTFEVMVIDDGGRTGPRRTACLRFLRDAQRPGARSSFRPAARLRRSARELRQRRARIFRRTITYSARRGIGAGLGAVLDGSKQVSYHWTRGAAQPRPRARKPRIWRLPPIPAGAASTAGVAAFRLPSGGMMRARGPGRARRDRRDDAADAVRGAGSTGAPDS